MLKMEHSSINQMAEPEELRLTVSESDLPPKIQDNQHEPPRESASILPLPTEVIAQIKSSVAITSLTAVILGLVENSLDAQASKLTVEVDFVRGDCVVEDDGRGILPQEFGEGGGLGKLYRMYCS
jgi:signal transduction histidine kinase